MFVRAAQRFGARTAGRVATISTVRTTVRPRTRFVAPLLVVAAGVAGATTVAVAEEKKVDYAQVRKDIAGILEKDDHDDGSLGPIFVRLAWHASGTYCKNTKTGGSNGGTIRFQPEIGHGANAGLWFAVQTLDKIKAKHPGISYGDLYTLAGVVAIEEMGGPAIGWRSGRTDAANGQACPPNGRLPDADKSQGHVRDIFYRMGFDDREIVALLGCHCFGRCHTKSSGYLGPWTRSPTTFSNLFYQELLNNRWTPKKWNGPLQYEDPSGDLMMTPADLSLIQDPAFKKYVEMYAKDEKLFAADFAKAFQKLTELGVTFKGGDCDKTQSWALLGTVVGLIAVSQIGAKN